MSSLTLNADGLREEVEGCGRMGQTEATPACSPGAPAPPKPTPVPDPIPKPVPEPSPEPTPSPFPDPTPQPPPKPTPKPQEPIEVTATAAGLAHPTGPDTDKT